MPLRSFINPGLMFLANGRPAERAYAHELLGKIRGTYPKYIEPGVGAFALATTIRDAGYPASAMTTSDIGLFTSTLGFLYSGQALAGLDVRVDGEPLDLPDDELEAAALILWTQLRLRIAAKKQAAYYDDLARDLDSRQDEHLADIRHDLVDEQRRIFAGVTYRPLGIWEEVDQWADDPQAVIVTNPPSYKGGYEKFYDTDGRLEWAEPAYEIWDPASDFERLMERMDGARALLVLHQECEPRQSASPNPVYAHDEQRDIYHYWMSNRTDEVLAVTGRRVHRRKVEDIEPIDAPIIGADDDITPSSNIEVRLATPAQAGYYKHLWLHRIRSGRAGYSVLVLVDGKVAATAGFDIGTIVRPQGKGAHRDAVLLMNHVGAPHNRYRLGRLATQLAFQYRVLLDVIGPYYATAAERVVTSNWTPHPENKAMRGLMKLSDRRIPDPQAGYRLLYEAPIANLTPEEVLRQWLANEQRRLKSA